MIDIFKSEQTVEEMIIHGRAILGGAIAYYQPSAVVAAFSGGNDSIVSTHFAVSQYGTSVVHCDTRIGLQATADHVRSVARRFGWSLDVRYADPEGPGKTKIKTLPNGFWTDGATAYEEFVLNQGFPSPPQHGRMYQRLKERSLRQVARDECPARGGKLLIVSGIRQDESSRRAGYNRAAMAQPKTKLVWVNPFYYKTAADFEAYRQEFGLPRNPVKDRIGVSGECCCGSFAKEAERAAICSADPAFSAYLDDLESRAKLLSFPWGWGERPPQWWLDERRGQGLLFDFYADDGPEFRPMCVGCLRRR